MVGRKTLVCQPATREIVLLRIYVLVLATIKQHPETYWRSIAMTNDANLIGKRHPVGQRRWTKCERKASVLWYLICLNMRSPFERVSRKKKQESKERTRLDLHMESRTCDVLPRCIVENISKSPKRNSFKRNEMKRIQLTTRTKLE